MGTAPHIWVDEVLSVSRRIQSNRIQETKRQRLSAVTSAVEAIFSNNGGYLTDRTESQVPAKQLCLAGFRVGNRLTRNEQVGGSSPLVSSSRFLRFAGKTQSRSTDSARVPG